MEEEMHNILVRFDTVIYLTRADDGYQNIIGAYLFTFFRSRKHWHNMHIVDPQKCKTLIKPRKVIEQ
jgi:hypothetical protein